MKNFSELLALVNNVFGMVVVVIVVGLLLLCVVLACIGVVGLGGL